MQQGTWLSPKVFSGLASGFRIQGLVPGNYLGNAKAYAPCLSSIDCLFEEKPKLHGVDDTVSVSVHFVCVEG